MTTPVKYIGRKPSYTDFVHGSKLTFEPGQTRVIPDDSLARKFLRQVDIFERGAQEQAQTSDAAPPGVTKDDTTKLLDDAQKTKDEALEKDNQRNDLVNQVRAMDRSQLEILANDRWGQKLHPRLSLENARAKVLQFVDQYGVA
ncbi:MAG: hypothetical protein QE485_10615 [Acidovorax sp.]|uniref:hypothetical protein n=1 Tax=Acidovorax sp. TaxID=1872122 RepID=UPI002623ED68|nr:hypothetical protein [Acidovorax sp.]MDH4417667.1 hypothetical protein [Acidovorax sp.]